MNQKLMFTKHPVWLEVTTLEDTVRSISDSLPQHSALRINLQLNDTASLASSLIKESIEEKNDKAREQLTRRALAALKAISHLVMSARDVGYINMRRYKEAEKMVIKARRVVEDYLSNA